MIWEIIHPQYPGKISYIMGTMHTRDDAAYTYYRLAKELIARSDFYWGEMELSDNTSHAELPEVMHELRIDKKLSIKRIKRLKRHFGLSEKQVILPYMQVINVIHEKINPPKYMIPLDMALQDYARSCLKPVAGIESLEEQLHYYSLLTQESDGRELFKISRNPRHLVKTIKRLSVSYTENDIVKLHKQSKKQLGKHRQVMLNLRNRIMSDRIAHLDFSKSHFIAIGAAHLWGGNGVLRLLKQTGLTIKRSNIPTSKYIQTEDLV